MGTTTQSIHESYLNLLKMHDMPVPKKLPYIIFERGWYEWLKCGFDEDDLALVLKWLVKTNAKADPRYRIQFTLKHILDLEKFSEWYERAGRWASSLNKPKRDPNRDSVIIASGREPELPKTRHIGEVLAAIAKQEGRN
jgi:hypothetical protein